MVVGFLAVVLGTANVVGGFVVTDRMLEMFKGRASRKPRSEQDDDRSALPGHDRDLHPRPPLPLLAPASAAGQSARGGGDGARDRGHPGAGGLENFAWIGLAMAIGSGDRGRRRPLGEDDGDAADGGPLQRGRRRRGGADRAGVSQPDAAARRPRGGGVDRDPALGADRQHLVLGLADRVREAAGAAERPADRVCGAAVRERRRCCSRLGDGRR